MRRKKNGIFPSIMCHILRFHLLLTKQGIILYMHPTYHLRFFILKQLMGSRQIVTHKLKLENSNIILQQRKTKQCFDYDILLSPFYV